MQPNWSPDSQKIAFTVWDGKPRIDVMDADGKNRTTLVGEARAPSWSPDGKQILFVSAINWGSEFMVIGADGQGLEKLKHPLRGGNPSFSPDGRRIAYDADHGGSVHIFVVEAGWQKFQRGSHTINTVIGILHGLSDGETIAYVAPHDAIPFGAEIHLMTAEGKYIKRLSKGRDGIDEQPDFGPGGLAVSPASKTATIWGKLKIPFGK